MERERSRRVPGVVFRVPAMMPCQPWFLAASSTLLDLRARRPGPMSAAATSAAQEGDSLYVKDALGCDPAAPRHRVERDSLSKQEASSGASNGRDFDFGSVLGRSDGVTFLQVPLDAVSHPSQEWSELGPSPGSNKEKERTDVQPSWAKISSTNGTPAKTPYIPGDRVNIARDSLPAHESARDAPRSCPTRSLPLAPLRRRSRHSRTRACLRRASR